MRSVQENSLAFGVGCFHFGVKKLPPFKFKGSEYIKELKEVLHSISNISNVEIDCHKHFEDFSTDIDNELPLISKGHGFFPNERSFSLTFEVYVPFRIQKDILKREARLFSEKFCVWIFNTYYFPVTIIEIIDPSKDPEPSDAVVVVRKFLENEFEKAKSNYIRFEFLGPSPFHAYFYIRPKESGDKDRTDWRYDAERISNVLGYDSVIFHYNKSVYKEVADAMDDILRENLEAIGFFYEIVQKRAEKMFDWLPIEDLVKKLVTIQRMKGIKGKSNRLFRRSNLIGEALTDIAAFQSNASEFSNDIKRTYELIFKGRKESCFQAYIDEQIKDDYFYPTKEYSELINFFEQRRTKSLEILIVFVSAIIGGSIGALITILLTK